MIPDKFDCIIIGTGLTNSIVAAACSRIGKTVLHVDKDGYYGGEWASFTFQQLLEWIETNDPNNRCLQQVSNDLKDKSRMFCIDLCPRLLFSNGAMVELLVKSNVARYHEFKNNIRILSMVNDELHVMPCRRSDVFTSPLFEDLLDKRRLMKFIEMCIKLDLDAGPDESNVLASSLEKPIGPFLESQGLKFNLREYIVNSIAMVDANDTVLKAAESIKRFMIAIERFGRSPFVFPLYGCGEYPQSFCRLSAVFGGLYCLNTQTESLSIQDRSEAEEMFKIKFSTHQQVVTCNNLIVDHCNIEQLNIGATIVKQKKLSRAILITDRSLVENDGKLLTFLRLPPRAHANRNLVYLLELNSSAMVCPLEVNILYLWTESSSDNAYSDLEPILKKHVPQEIVKWSYCYQQLKRVSCSQNIPGLHVTSPPLEDLDYSECILEAEKIFLSMFPDEEFLPRAPDPDEIVTSSPEDIE